MLVKTQVSSWPRHVTGDWGDLDDEDRQANDAALINGSRILSAYMTRKGERIWIITEAMNEVGLRYCTTLLQALGVLNDQPGSTRLNVTPSGRV